MAYLAGNKQLAQQIERQARDLGFPVVRFQGGKESWDKKDVRTYNFARAIGVMNYWNYFNANPGVDPAGILILDDVHLLESPLRDYFTVFVETGTRTCSRILSRIVAQSPYYRLAEDLRHGVEPGRAPEMLVFPDSADLADEVRELLDARIEAYSDPWWAWVRIRDHLEVCCWLLSPRGITFTPYIPPTQTIPHFQEPERRLYLSATVGSVDDLQRRLGTPPFKKLTASAQPRQGERFVLMLNSTKVLAPSVLVRGLRRFLLDHHKALWLCTASSRVRTTRRHRRRRAALLTLPRRRQPTRSKGSSRSGMKTTVAPPPSSIASPGPCARQRSTRRSGWRCGPSPCTSPLAMATRQPRSRRVRHCAPQRVPAP